MAVLPFGVEGFFGGEGVFGAGDIDISSAETNEPGPGLYGPGAEDLALDDYGTG